MSDQVSISFDQVFVVEDGDNVQIMTIGLQGPQGIQGIQGPLNPNAVVTTDIGVSVMGYSANLAALAAAAIVTGGRVVLGGGSDDLTNKLQVNGNVKATGVFIADGGTLGLGSAAGPAALQLNSNGTFGFLFSGANRVTIGSSFIELNTGGKFLWSSGSNGTQAADTGLARASAGVVEINNGTAGVLGDLSVKNVVAATVGAASAIGTNIAFSVASQNNDGIYANSGALKIGSNAALGFGGTTGVPNSYDARIVRLASGRLGVGATAPADDGVSALQVNGAVAASGVIYANGGINLPNTTGLIRFRNALNTLDLNAIQVDVNNTLLLGSQTAGVQFNTNVQIPGTNNLQLGTGTFTMGGGAMYSTAAEGTTGTLFAFLRNGTAYSLATSKQFNFNGAMSIWGDGRVTVPGNVILGSTTDNFVGILQVTGTQTLTGSLGIGTTTFSDNTQTYQVWMRPFVSGNNEGGGLAIGNSQPQDLGKAFLSIQNTSIIDTTSTRYKPNIVSSGLFSTGLPSVSPMQTGRGGVHNFSAIQGAANLIYQNANFFINCTNVTNTSALVHNNIQAYVYVQGTSGGAAASLGIVENIRSRGQFATTNASVVDFRDFHSDIWPGIAGAGNLITTRTALLIDWDNTNVTNARGIWQTSGTLVNALVGRTISGGTTDDGISASQVRATGDNPAETVYAAVAAPTTDVWRVVGSNGTTVNLAARWVTGMVNNSIGLWVSGQSAFGGTVQDPNAILTAANNVTNPGAASTAISGSRNLSLTVTSGVLLNGVTGTANILASTSVAYTGTARGLFGQSQNASTFAVSGMSGVEGMSYNVGAGTVAKASGFYSSIQNLVAGGTITEAFGLNVGPGFNNGTIGSFYGVYLDTLPAGGTITNKWGVYQKDATARNYFNGRVLIGTATDDLSNLLQVNGPTKITGNLSAYQASGGGVQYLTVATVDAANAYLRFTTANTSRYVIGADASDGSFKIGTANDFTTTRLMISSAGRLLLGTVTDDLTNLVQVNGKGRFYDDLTQGPTPGSTMFMTGGSALRATSNLYLDTTSTGDVYIRPGLFTVVSILNNRRVLIGTNTDDLTNTLQIGGSVAATSVKVGTGLVGNLFDLNSVSPNALVLHSGATTKLSVDLSTTAATFYFANGATLVGYSDNMVNLKWALSSANGRMGLGGVNPTVAMHIKGDSVAANDGLIIERWSTSSQFVQLSTGAGASAFSLVGNSPTTNPKNAYVSNLTTGGAVAAGLATLTFSVGSSLAPILAVVIENTTGAVAFASTIQPNGGYKSVDGSAGVSGTWTTTDGKTITAKNGIITAIV